MLSYRKTLFPKQRRVFWTPRALKKTGNPPTSASLYDLLVTPGSPYEDGKTSFDHITILEVKITSEVTETHRSFFRKSDRVDLNEIHVCDLYKCILVDDGTFCSERVDQGRVYSNFKDFHRLKGKKWYNFSNENAPLRIFQLQRVYDSFNEEEKDLKYSTFWETKVLDHTTNVPCARTGHSVIVSNDKECVYVIGGVTVLADEEFRGQAKIPDESWFLYPLQDVWEFSLPTGKWRKVANLRPRSDIVSDWHFIEKMSNFAFNFDTVYDSQYDVLYGCFQQIDQGDKPGTKPLVKIFWVKPSSKRYGEQSVQIRGQSVRREVRSRVEITSDGFALNIAAEDGERAEKLCFKTRRTCLDDDADSPKQMKVDSCCAERFCDFAKYDS